MKKLINSPDNVVLESITGLGAAFSDLIKIHTDPNYIIRADAPVKDKVALVSGGGSGHEPMHGGFVGRGMLDAACPGAIFTSPTPDQMFEAAKAASGGAGVLQIVKIILVTCSTSRWPPRWRGPRASRWRASQSTTT